MRWTWIILAAAANLYAQPVYRVVDVFAGTNGFGVPWGLNDS